MAEPIKKTALNQWHHGHQAKMVEFGGWEMPIQYQQGIVAEHLATRKAAGLFDVSHMGRFGILGRDRMAFLQKALTNNALSLEPWQAQYTIIADPQGGAIDDAFLYRFGEDDYLLVVNASNAQKDWDHLSGLAKEFQDLELVDLTSDLQLVACQGPASKAMIESLVQEGAMPEPKQGALSEVVIQGQRVRLARTGYTGEPNSFELFVPAEGVVAVWEALLAAGAEAGAAPVGLGARDTLRLEAGMPLYGHELGLDPEGKPIPVFAIALAPVAVSLSPLKGEFVGKEALAEQYAEYLAQRRGQTGPWRHLPRRIRPLAVEDRGIARQGAEVFLEGRRVGVVTSGTSVPYWKFTGSGATWHRTEEHALRSLALAYLEADIQPETEVEVVVRKRRLRARVVKSHGRADAPPYFHPLPVGWQRPRRSPSQGEGLAKFEVLLKRALDNHQWRQGQCINLIPSEMTPSPLVRLLSVSDPVGRYAEHRRLEAVFDQEVFYYQGTDFIAWVEDRLAAEMADYLGCPQVEVRPLSGQMANMTVYSALVQWKNRGAPKSEPRRLERVLAHHLGRGGHLSAQPMGALRDYVAKDPVSERYAVLNFPVLPDDPFQVDEAETSRLLEEYQPELVVFGRSMTIEKEPVQAVRQAVEEMKRPPILMYDMAHTLGLLGPHFQQPFQEGADLLTASTHKTFFGTQRGVIGCRFDQEGTPGYELWQTIQGRTFPGMLSNHHLGTLLGLLAAAIEMNAFKERYQPQVLANAKALARGLRQAGVKVCGDPARDFTQTHQVIVEVGYAQGPEVARRLENNHIVCNYQALPWDEGFSASSGLRLGVAEMTRFGMKEDEFQELAQLMAEVILHNKEVGPEVARLRGRFQEMRYCFSEPELEGFKQRLLASF